MNNIDFKYLFTSAEGRISRQQWWIGVGILFLFSMVTTILFGNDGLVAFIIGILMMIAGIMLHIKRCHDRDKSGWWCLLLFIPFVGLIWAIIDLGILPGTVGANQYGPDPVGT